MTKLLGKINSVLFYFTIAISFILLITACSKPAGLIGVIVQPDDSKLKVGYTDTVTVRAFSKEQDSIRSSQLTTSQLGSNQDPVFGQTIAGTYLQFNMELAEHSFGGESAVVDSLVLYMLYSSTYGDTNTAQTIRAYKIEMEEPLDKDSIYFSNIEVQTGSVDYANFEYSPRPNDTLFINGDTVPRIQRVNLMANPELADYLINAEASDMASNEDFIKYFNGLYLVTDPVTEGGAIVSYNVFSSSSRMILYYHNEDADSLNFDYTITSQNAVVNKYMHDYTQGSLSFKEQIVDGDTLLGKENVYIQGLAGITTIIKFPFITEWRKLGPVAFNEAKLVLNGSSSDPLWGAPTQLTLAEIQDDGTLGFLVDQVEEPDLYFGGDYKSSTNSYTFRIGRYLQALVDDPDKKDNGLYLIPAGVSINPNRFIFDGHQPTIDTARRLKVELLFTELD